MENKNRNKKLNCWEYTRCGKGSAGKESGHSVPCPVMLEKGLDTMHGGINGGRACWVVVGTLCDGGGGRPRAKSKRCRKCTFYVKVRIEEGMNFRMPTVLLNMRGSVDVNRTGEDLKITD